VSALGRLDRFAGTRRRTAIRALDEARRRRGRRLTGKHSLSLKAIGLAITSYLLLGCANMRTTAAVLLAVLPLAGTRAAESAFTVAGRYEYRRDAESLEVLGDAVCFFPSPGSAQAPPRLRSDRRLAWFCFTDTRRSKKMLGIQSPPRTNACGLTGEATVRVENYVPYVGEGDGFDTASLHSVRRLSKVRMLPCQ